MLDAVEVLAAVRDLEVHPPWPFRRPLRMGDAEQARAMAIINGERPFCNRCLAVLVGHTLTGVGRECSRPGCRGHFVPGAKGMDQWKRWAGIDADLDGPLPEDVAAYRREAAVRRASVRPQRTLFGEAS